MELPARFHELPVWAKVLAGLFGVLVAVTAASVPLGVLFAAIAVGVETGSALAAVLAGTVGVGVLVAPVVALVWWLRSTTTVQPVDDDGDTVDDLREQYLDGEIDEATFERRLEAFLDDGEALEFEPTNEAAIDAERPATETFEHNHER